MAITFAIKRLTSAAILQPSSSKHCGPVMVDSGDVLELVQSYNAATDALKKSQAERDALAAQVAILKTAYGNLVGAINNLDDTDTDSEEIVDEMWGEVFSVMQDGWNSFSREPQQCLAEIRAEAGRVGYIAGVNDRACEYMDQSQIQAGADYHAAKIRKGEL